jgi:hypothetical protein
LSSTAKVRWGLVVATVMPDRGIADLITMDVSTAPEIETLRDHAFRGLVTVIDRAKAAGALRADATPQDILVILVTRARPAEREASRRLIHLLLDGLRAEGATAGPPAPSAQRMRLAMRDHSRRTGLLNQPGAATSPKPGKGHA